MKSFIFSRGKLAALAFLLISTSGSALDFFERSDLFEYSNLTEIQHSALVSTAENPYYFDIRDLFGGGFGPVERNGHIVFADQLPPEGFDFVEFQTAAPVTLHGIRLVAQRDQSTPSRETGEVVFYAMDHSGIFQEKDRFTPAYLESVNYQVLGFLGVANSVRQFQSPVYSSRFRIEFKRGPLNSGPRLVELDAMTHNPELPTVEILNLNADTSISIGDSFSVEVGAEDPQGIGQVSVYQ